MPCGRTPTLSIGPYVVGEKPEPLVYTFTDSDGNPLDLSGYQVVFEVRRRSSSSPSTYAGTLVDGPTGQVSYTWTGNEWTTAGSYWSEFWVGNGTNRWASWRFQYTVRTPVGAVPAI